MKMKCIERNVIYHPIDTFIGATAREGSEDHGVVRSISLMLGAAKMQTTSWFAWAPMQVTFAEARKASRRGKKVGVVRPRVFRPFEKQIAEARKNAKGIAVIDRSDSSGSPSALLVFEVRERTHRVRLNTWFRLHRRSCGC